MLLRQYVWPVAKEDMVAHDSWHCQDFPSPMNRPWPVRRRVGGSNFVGAIGDKFGTRRECPIECRPKEHPEWTLC